MKAITEEIKEDDIEAIKLEKTFFQQCKKDINDYPPLNAEGAILKNIMVEFESILGQPFPLLKKDFETTKPTPEALGKALGYMSGKYGLGTFIDNMVYTNTRNPDKGYSVYLDAGYFATDKFYKMGLPDMFMPFLIETELENFLRISSDEAIDKDALLKEAAQFFLIEVALKQSYTPVPIDGRNATQRYPVMTLGEAIEAFNGPIDIRSYLEGFVSQIPEVKDKVTNDKYEIVILDPVNFFNFLQAFNKLPDLGVTTKNLVNYLYYAAMQVNGGSFLPPAKKETLNMANLEGFDPNNRTELLKRMKYERKLPKDPISGIHYPESKVPLEQDQRLLVEGITQVDVECYQMTSSLFQEANNALFVKATYPVEEKRTEDRKGVAKFVDSILIGFRTMLDQLEWMRKDSKEVKLSIL